MRKNTKLTTEAFQDWLVQGSYEAATGAAVVMDAKTCVWEEFQKAVEKDFWLAMTKF